MYPDLSNIIVKRATNKHDLDKVFDLRWQGYKKYFQSKNKIVDKYDHAPGCILLLATDLDGTPLGTIRILDRRFNRIEIDEFISVNDLISEDLHPCAEANRFSVPGRANSQLIKLALWKTFFAYCCANEIRSIVVCVRPSAARDYISLGFQSLGDVGVFKHNLLGNVEHHTYSLNIRSAESHPLYPFFSTDSPQLSFS